MKRGPVSSNLPPNKRLLLARKTSGSRAPLAVHILDAQQNRETLGSFQATAQGYDDVTESPERSSESDSEEPAMQPLQAIQDLGTAETAVDLADVNDALEVLARSSTFGKMLGWTMGGLLMLLIGTFGDEGAPYFVALIPFLVAAYHCPSYLRERASRRELKARLELLQMR